MRDREIIRYHKVKDLIKRLIGDILRKLKRIPSHLSQIVDDVVYDEHVRRAFANNAFDGVLTLLGILMGNLVELGLGVAVIHPFVADHFAGRLEVRPFEPAIEISYGLVFPEGSHRLRIVDSFAEKMRQCFSDSQYMAQETR